MLDDFEIKPPGWTYNPSSWGQRIPVCVIALLGFLIAVYMGLYQWRLIDGVFDPVFGQQTREVLDSDVSHSMKGWLGIPDAILGAFAYMGDAVFGLAGSTSRWKTRPWMVILFGIDVIPLGIVSIILVVLQGTVVGSWCFLCLASALFSLILIVLAYDEVWASIRLLRGVWRQSKSKTVLWDVFWGRTHTIREQVALDWSAE